MDTKCLNPIFCGALFLAGTCVLSGCTSMMGNVANSSGMGYYERGNFVAAADEFQQALAAEPGNPDYLANLARTRLKMGDAHSAESLFRQALTLSPSHQPSYRGLADLMVAQNRSAEAQAMLSTWSGSQPDNSEPLIEIARLHSQSGQMQQAQAALEKALQVNPGDPVALAAMGSFYEAGGRSDLAVGMYQQSLRSDWNQGQIHSRLAEATRNATAPGAFAPAAIPPGAIAQTGMNGPMQPWNPAAGQQQGPMNFPVQTAGGFMPQPALPGPYPMAMAGGLTPPPPGPWQIVSESSPQMQSVPTAQPIQFSEPIITQPAPPAAVPPATQSVAQPTPDPAFSATPVFSESVPSAQPAAITTLGSSEPENSSAEAALPFVPSF